MAAGDVNTVELEEGALEAEPSTHVRTDGNTRSSFQLVDLIEEGWTKVGSRKKNRRRKK